MIPIWIFTQQGFFSVVQHRTKPTKVFVRARRRGDLERLATALGLKLVIEQRPNNDYMWATVVDKFTWRGYLADAVDAIDYDYGVKDRLDLGEADRHTAMYKVWSAMMELQEGGIYNNRRPVTDPDQSVWDYLDGHEDTPETDYLDGGGGVMGIGHGSLRGHL